MIYKNLKESYNIFENGNSYINEVIGSETDNPGAGWYLLFAGGTSTLVDIASEIVVLIIILIISSIILLLITISQFIARLSQIGNEKKWKNSTSKIFIYITIVLQVLLFFVLISNLLSNLNFNRIFINISIDFKYNMYCSIYKKTIAN